MHHSYIFHKEIDELIDNYVKICSQEPEQAENWQLLGRALVDAERFEQAEKALETFFDKGRFLRFKKGVPRLRLTTFIHYRQNRILFAKVYSDLGAISLNNGDLASAQRMLMLALREFEKENMDAEYIRAAHCLGTIYRISGNFDMAEELFRHTEKTAIQNKWPFQQATSLGHLGLIAFAKEQFDVSEQYHQQACDIYKQHNYLQESAWQQRSVAMAQLFQNKKQKAVEHLLSALSVFEKMTNDTYCSRLYGDLASAHSFGDDTDNDAILQYAQKSLDYALKSGNDTQTAESRFALARFKITCQAEDDTLPVLLSEVIAYYEKRRIVPSWAEAVSTLGLHYLHQGDLEKAESCFRDSLRLEQRLRRLFGQATDYANLGLIFQKKGNVEKALSCYEKARTLFVADGNCLLAEDMSKKIKEL